MGNARRDFIHVYDVCSAIYKSICYGKLGETYHIASKKTNYNKKIS